MSLNTAHANGGVLIHSGELILLFSDHVTMEFHGQEQPEFLGPKKGRLYLTTHRMIFNAKDQREKMQSFSFPFITLNEVEVEQPMFGANYIKGKCRAQPNGNWVGECKFKLHFKSGGAIEFGTAMLRAAQMAQRNGPDSDAPPPYQPPPTNWYAAPPPAYQAAPTGYYGWVPPTHAFPDQPPANSVFMTDMPPPYPGINAAYQGYDGPAAQQQPGAWGPTPGANPHPQQNGAPAWANPNYNGQPMSQADAKAAEAAQSAYYDPNRPQCAYVPPPAYYESPPSFQQATEKKNQ
ncbi:WW domain-binding protein 2 isoform X2 [Copidosoma floridanum]|uniref:WW domain-binding protein 2 isoform X2 n=1 Tax=Copidosoma floridanum TaxID=29053 RepID=UPI0006C9D2E0|nr:WW domain-binding protein 2 isoform X2 [Copidosoma floridanum]